MLIGIILLPMTKKNVKCILANSMEEISVKESRGQPKYGALH
jgi:hypothetical protein